MGPTECHDSAAQTVTEPSPCLVSLLELAIPDWVFWCGEQREGWPQHASPVVKVSHHSTRIWALLSVIRGIVISVEPTLNIGYVKLTWDRVVQTGSSRFKNIQLYYHLGSSGSVAFWNSPSQNVQFYRHLDSSGSVAFWNSPSQNVQLYSWAQVPWYTYRVSWRLVDWYRLSEVDESERVMEDSQTHSSIEIA
jgi:hypothetical protein